MEGFVPYHLDGDAGDAQLWADRLGISAYPTVLVLGPGRDERMRISGSVDIDELEEALRTVRGGNRDFDAAVRRLVAGTASDDDLHLLAFAGWEQLPAPDLGLLKKAADACPEALRRERSSLTATLLGLAAIHRDAEAQKEPVRAVAAGAPRYLDAVFASTDTVWAARAFVNHRAADVAAYLYPDVRPDDPAYVALKQRWLAAAAGIREHEGASVDVRLWTVGPALAFFFHERPDGPVPPTLRDEIEAAVRRADAEARTHAERQAVISGAAYLLRRVGAADRAREMLVAEAERSDTPWYDYTTLSALEAALGRTEEARRWSEKARASARGRATRIQWITNDIVLNAGLPSPDRNVYLLGLLEELYSLCVAQPDGFSGRNRTRADQVAAAVAPFRKEPDFARLFARFGARCADLASEGRAACQAHFEKLR